MTTPNPGGLTPGQWGVTGTDGSIPSKATQTQAAVTTTLQNQFTSNQFSGLGGGLIAMILSFIGGAVGNILGGFASVIEAIFGTVNNQYVSEIPIITDHTNSINDLTAQFSQFLLQGLAIVFTSNNSYTPSAGIVSVDLIVIGAGGGGGAGPWDVITARQGAAGGGGGGEVHVNIPAALFPVDGSGNFLPITITIGAGGSGGVATKDPGVGGGNTSFGAWITAGGGNGGYGGDLAAGLGTSAGGTGLIIGGLGAAPAQGGVAAIAGGNSSSQFDLHGGGGGGGGGSSSISAPTAGSAGGQGGISPGGQTPGANGTAPATVIATGGGGGAGGSKNTTQAGHGAFPAGGGGGGGQGDSSSNFGKGGLGGAGILFCIERSS